VRKVLSGIHDDVPAVSNSPPTPIAPIQAEEVLSTSPVFATRMAHQAPSPVRHPFQAAAKVRLVQNTEAADDERSKQVARLRAKIASHKKKLVALEEELQRLLYGEDEVAPEFAVPSGDVTQRSSESPRRRRISAGRKKPSAMAAELASGPKVKLDKSWEIDPSQVYVEKVLGGV
jgi:hypothetical protein